MAERTMTFWGLKDSKGQKMLCDAPIGDYWKCSLQKGHKGKHEGYGGHDLFNNEVRIEGEKD